MTRVPRKRKTRRIKTPKAETASERQQRTAVSFIMQNPFYQQILQAIRSGTPNSKIAEHFVITGVFEGINQKTAVGYLQYFKRAQPALCRPMSVSEDETAPFDYMDRMFNPTFSIIDEETELIRLINLQKARLGMAFSNEREINVLIQSNRREVEELRNLLVDLAKLRGKLGSSMDVNLHGYGDNVKDDLKSIQHDENQRQTIATLVADLAKVSNG